MTVNFKDEIRKDAEAMLDHHNVRDEFKSMSVEARKEYCDNDRVGYDVLILNVTGDLNVSNILRTSLCLGAGKVITVGRQKIDARGFVGCDNYINIEKHSALSDDLVIDENVVMDVFKSNPNYLPVFVETGGETLGEFSWKDIVGNKRPLLIFGNEGRGIGDNILALRDKIDSITVGIPMKGVCRSFNVSAAAAIVSWSLVEGMGWV
jgi:tRNA G18 (ribose-2'-O)-methylase SpoU